MSPNLCTHLARLNRQPGRLCAPLGPGTGPGTGPTAGPTTGPTARPTARPTAGNRTESRCTVMSASSRSSVLPSSMAKRAGVGQGRQDKQCVGFAPMRSLAYPSRHGCHRATRSTSSLLIRHCCRVTPFFGTGLELESCRGCQRMSLLLVLLHYC